MIHINWKEVSKAALIGLVIAVAFFWLSGVLNRDTAANGAEVGLATTVRWNCQNFFTSQHPVPVSIEQNENMGWTVVMSDDTMMYATWIGNEFLKFNWQDAWWMTDGVNVVFCKPDLQSMSILLAQ